jgi:hypothetical protein
MLLRKADEPAQPPDILLGDVYPVLGKGSEYVFYLDRTELIGEKRVDVLEGDDCAALADERLNNPLDLRTKAARHRTLLGQG